MYVVGAAGQRFIIETKSGTAGKSSVMKQSGIGLSSRPWMRGMRVMGPFAEGRFGIDCRSHPDRIRGVCALGDLEKFHTEAVKARQYEQNELLLRPSGEFEHNRETRRML